MSGYIEWKNEDSGLSERADIINTVSNGEVYNIVFSNNHLGSEGTLELIRATGAQLTHGTYGYTCGSYYGKAKVMGHITTTPAVTEFTGTWLDAMDGTGQWDLYLYINEVPDHDGTSLILGERAP